jgi:16S rRNA (cytosine967-C5)-methyltransferase
MNSLAGVAVRVLSARVLDAVMHRGRSLKAELAATLPQIADVRDRALLEAICFSALRQRARYDAALRTWLQKPLGARDGELRALLFAGFAQIDVLQLPAHAALSATVEATRAIGRPHQAGMVNAVLRRAQREGFPAADPAALWPGWLRKQVIEDWAEQAEAIFAASAREAPLWLRVNRRTGTREDYLERLAQAGIEATPSPFLTDAVRVDAPVSVVALPGFAQGEVSVQDGAAQAVADALAPPPAAYLLDACAAPGGKAAHLLERDPSLRLLALDVDRRRLERVRETLVRVGVDAQTQVADAGEPQAWWDGRPFDAVLLDAPCSATGIVRRQPDVLLHRRAEDIAALVALQARLLDSVWQTLKPGGVLVYATCSLLQAENQTQITAFLSRTADARADELDDHFGQISGAGRQRLPGEDGLDGFFYARIVKHV